MSNLAPKIDFVPRSGLQRTLRYHSHLRWMYKAFLVIDGLMWCVCLAPLAPHLLKVPPLVALVGFVALSILPFLLFLQTWFQLRPLALTTVEAFSDRMEVDVAGKKRTVLYQDIKEIKFAHIPHAGGWFKVVTSKGNYRFTVMLERSEYILESIMSFDQNLVQPAQLESYRKTAIQADHGLSFLYDYLRALKKDISSKMLIAPAIATVAFIVTDFFKGYAIDLKNVLTSLIVSGGLQLAAMMLAHFIISMRHQKTTRASLDKNPNHLLRDLDFEHSLILANKKYQHILFAALVAVFLIFA